MNSDSDSEIEVWDGVKPSASAAQPAADVSINNAVNRAGARPDSFRTIKSSPGVSGKRKSSDAFPRAQGGSFLSQRSPPGRQIDASVIDLTDDNIDVDGALLQDSTAPKNNISDRATKQEPSAVNSISTKRLKPDIARKSLSSSISENPSVPSQPRRATLPSQQPSASADGENIIDLTDDKDNSPAELQPPQPLPSADAQQPVAAFRPESVFPQPKADESQCGNSNRSTTNMDLKIDNSDEHSSRSSRSSVLSKTKPNDEFQLRDYDADSSVPSYATQKSVSSDSEEDIPQRDDQPLQDPRNDIFETVTDSPLPSDANPSSFGDGYTEDAAMSMQTTESLVGNPETFAPSPAAKKRVRSRKGPQRTEPFVETDESESDSDTDSSSSAGTPSHPNEINAPTLAKKRLVSRKGPQRTEPFVETDESESDSDTDSSSTSGTPSHPNEISAPAVAKKRVVSRKGGQRTKPFVETDESESDSDTDSSSRSGVPSHPNAISAPAVAKKRVVSRKGSQQIKPLDGRDNETDGDTDNLSSSAADPSESTESHNMVDTMHASSIVAKKRVTSRMESQRTTPLPEIEYESDWGTDSSFSAIETSELKGESEIRAPSPVAKKRVRSRKGAQRTELFIERDYESESDSDTDLSFSSVKPSQSNEIITPDAVAKKRVMSRKESQQIRPLISHKGSQRTTPLAETEYESDWETDVSYETEENEEDAAVGNVTAVCRATGNTGYPIRRFSVYGGFDDVLYDFGIFIEKSSIPNAGMGAFLTYMGARKLNTSLATPKLCENLLSDCFYHEEATMSPLIAAMPDGRTKSVSLTGDNLHGNYNCVYWPGGLPSKLLSAKANGKTIKVRIVGECLETFEELKDRPKDGIGHLGMYSESDYEHVSGIPYKANLIIELDAPYAPLGPNDRKIATVFDIKSFLFDNEPSEWPFDVDEKILGQDQVCDVTDDTTGRPHEYARKEVPMYVNEVGHSGLKENVLIRHEHSRTVKYYVQLKNAMKPGETVELLTNYGTQYENVRLRKGYGLKNIYRGDKSDDDLGSRLKRNFSLRTTIETEYSTLSLPELNRVLDYVCNQIWVPLCAMVGDTFAAPDFPSSASRLTPIQWVAFLRLLWFRTIAEKRLDQLKTSLDKQPNTVLFCGGLINSCSMSLQKIRFPDGVSLVGLLDQLEARKNLSVELLRVSETITRELTEEFYYGLRDCIRHPFCAEMWCTIGVKVLSDVGRGYVKLKLESLEKSRAIDQAKLEALLIEVAAESSQRMEVAKIGQFYFSSGTSCDRLSLDVLKRVFDEAKVEKAAALMENNDKLPKALHALAYKWLAKVPSESEENVQDVHVSFDKKFLVLCGTQDVGSLTSYVAEGASAEHKQGSVLNRTYYKVWQIAFVIMACAHIHLDERSCDRIESAMSKALEIDRTLLAYAYNRQMTTDRKAAAYLIYHEAKEAAKKLYKSRVRNAREEQKKRAHEVKHPPKRSTARAERPEKKQKSKSSNRPPALLIYEGPPQTKLEQAGRSIPWPKGWTQRTYQRQTGDSKGQTDYYFFSPVRKIRLRSKTDVFRFLDKLEKCGGDEHRIDHKSA